MKRKPNILFVSFPSIPYHEILASFKGESKKPQPLSMPMGILYLSSYIKSYNELDEVKILDYQLALREVHRYKNIDDFLVNTAKRDVHFVPDIIAFSLMFSSSYHIFTLAVEHLKDLWPDAVTIAGGVHATGATKIILENQNVDYVVRGEGEITFSEFIKQYTISKEIRIKGIYHRSNLEETSFSQLSDYVGDLDVLPFPDRDLIDMETYAVSKGRKRSIGRSEERRIATVISSRGCPFKCVFCASHIMRGRKVRFRSPKNVAQEVQYLYERFKVNLIIPEDDMFTIPRDRCLRMISALKALRIPDFEIQVPSGLSVNALDTQIIDALLDVGVRIFTLAIESGSQYVQKNIIKKNCNLKKAKKLIQYLKNKDALVRCYFIFGFHGETIEQMKETREYAKSLNADWCVFNLAAPLVGSEMYNEMAKAGYIKDEVNIWLNTSFEERTFDTIEISASELKEFAYRTNLECNFINNYNKVSRQFRKAIAIYEDILRSYPFHIIALYCMGECYKGLGDFAMSDRINKQILVLMQENKGAAEMYEKYSDLMHDFSLSEKQKGRHNL